jgi:hypothetical protein
VQIDFDLARPCYAFRVRQLSVNPLPTQTSGLAWRGIVLLVLASAGALFASTASADGVTPIEVRLLGPKGVRVRVSRGSTLPCDSGDDRPIITGKFAPGEVVRASTPDECVCVQQTHEPFTDVDWAAGFMVCRPQICSNFDCGGTAIARLG